MPKDLYPDDFYCPKCGKNPSKSTIMTTQYSMYRLDLPYFMCGNCRFCSYDKRLIKQTISRWNKYSHATRRTPYKEIYRGSIELLEESMKYCVDKIGYQVAKFNMKKVTSA